MPEKVKKFVLPRDAEVDRFRSTVRTALERLIPKGAPHEEMVVAAYVLEAASVICKDRTTAVMERVDQLRQQAANLGVAMPPVPNVVGLVHRKANYVEGNVGNLVGEAARAFDGVARLMDQGVEGEVVHDEEPAPAADAEEGTRVDD